MANGGMEQVAIGVDIGGTKIAFALVGRSGEILATYRLPTPVEDGPEAVFQQVGAGVNHLMQQTQQPVAGIGIGCPGHLNPRTGIVYNATNLAWIDIPLLDGVRAYVPAEIQLWLQKDANTAALGEMLFGAARGYDDFVLLTIGTGLGGGAVSSGEIVNGANNSGMEIGHMPFTPAGRLCRCGMHGCPEMYVSGVGLLAGAREYLPEFPQSVLVHESDLTTEAILRAFHQHDPLAVRLLDEAADWLCSVMIACMGILNPGLFVIGGGLGHAMYDHFSSNVKAKLAMRTRREIYREVPIMESQVQDSAIGPACLVWHNIKG